MKENYINYVIQEYLADGNFDASFGDGWIDAERFAALGAEICDYAFAPYGIDAKGKYAGVAEVILDVMVKNNVIAQQGDDYSGYWFHLRSAHKKKHVEELQAKNPATSRISALGEEALRRALLKIVAEDGLRSMEEKWAAASNQEQLDILTDPEAERPGPVQSNLPKSPIPYFFQNEERREEFVSLADDALKQVEASELSNVEKSQAKGYLIAAKVLSENPEPPIDLIWTILNRANSLAGIGSFFLALIMLIGLVN